jgi:hypothetical protein
VPSQKPFRTSFTLPDAMPAPIDANSDPMSVQKTPRCIFLLYAALTEGLQNPTKFNFRNFEIEKSRIFEVQRRFSQNQTILRK